MYRPSGFANSPESPLFHALAGLRRRNTPWARGVYWYLPTHSQLDEPAAATSSCDTVAGYSLYGYKVAAAPSGRLGGIAVIASRGIP